MRAIALSRMAILHRVRMGRLHHVFRGVYAVGTVARTPLQRAAAAVLACGPGALLSHASAAALYGWCQWHRGPFHVTVTRGDRRPRGIVVHHSQALRRCDRRTQLGVWATSPARTMLDWAADLDEPKLRRAVRDARHSGFLTLDALAEVLERFPRHPAAARLRPFVTGETVLTDSELEVEFLRFCERYGLPTPETGAYIAGHRTDALFREQRLIVEIDSHEYHRDLVTFESDRDRDADTLAVDFATVRVTSERMRDRPLREAARLRRILRRRGWTG